MSLPLSIHFDNADPSECPTNLQELTDSMNARVSGELEGSFLPYVTGAATPAVDDQDKVWMKQDAQGRPVGTYMFYSGTWRRQYTLPVGTIAMYSGDPGVDFTGSGHAGTIGGNYDGWQICSGENGSPNLSDKFIIGAKMDDLGTGYPTNGPWKTTVTGESTASGAGVHDITLSAANSYRPAVSALVVGKWHAQDNTPEAGTGDLYGLAGASDFNLIEADPGNPAPPAIPTLPPWYALAYIIFQGYS